MTTNKLSKKSEIWKEIPIEGFEKYMVSNFGNVKNINTDKILSQSNRGGYFSVYLKPKDIDAQQKKIHRLVALTFVKNKDPENKKVVNHINGDKLDNRAENLEWVTASENVQHAVDNNLITVTKRAVIQCNLKTGKKIKEFESVTDASNETGISTGHICDAANGKWKQAGGFAWKYSKKDSAKVDIDMSKFKQLVDFPNYLINNEGQVYSLARKRFMKPIHRGDSGMNISLSEGDKQKTMLVHKLVASYFLKKNNDDHNHVHHKDGNRQNNNVSNLEWCYLGGMDKHKPESHFSHDYYDEKTAIPLTERKKAVKTIKSSGSKTSKSIGSKTNKSAGSKTASKLGSKTAIKSGSKTTSKISTKSGSKTAIKSGSKTSKSIGSKTSKTSKSIKYYEV
ncbi:HNH endonuclease [Acanthamoeba polyphaga mimivirus]|nr:HNH endonuclease [Acanthamoeba castellanii mamavirus]EJN40702.1 HNH endonuclease [Acanthamoeba polyphaga lentillevirus]UMZ08242.1 HNH endonuclease [Acanthamoeba polyphaga mimivirus]